MKKTKKNKHSRKCRGKNKQIPKVYSMINNYKQMENHDRIDRVPQGIKCK